MIPRKKTHQTATQGRKVRNYGTGINYGAAVEGGPMPVIMGTNQVAPTLVYFNPGPGTVEPYLGKNYACLWGLCEGVIDSVPRYWRDTKRYIGTPQTAVILPCRDAWVHGTADPTLDWTVFGLPADANTLGCITAEETTATTAPDGTTNHLTKLWWNRGWVYIFGGHNTTVQGPTGNAKYIESPEFAWPATPTALNVWLKAANFDGQKVWVSLITTSGTVVETQIKTLTVANWTTASMGAALTASSEGALFKLQIGGMAGPPSYDWWTECVHAVSSPVYVWLEGAGTEWAIHKGEVGQDVDAAISANWGDAYAVAHPPPPGAPGQQTPTPGTDSLSYSGIAYIATFDQYYNQDKPQIGNFLFEVKGPYTGTVASPRYDGDGTDANAATALEILLAAVVLP